MSTREFGELTSKRPNQGRVLEERTNEPPLSHEAKFTRGSSRRGNSGLPRMVAHHQDNRVDNGHGCPSCDGPSGSSNEERTHRKRPREEDEHTKKNVHHPKVEYNEEHQPSQKRNLPVENKDNHLGSTSEPYPKRQRQNSEFHQEEQDFRRRPHNGHSRSHHFGGQGQLNQRHYYHDYIPRRHRAGDDSWDNDRSSKWTITDPHIAQACALREDIPFNRVLAPDAPREKYQRRRGQLKSVIHWGQRKLLMSEIEFLTMYGNRGSEQLVIYAGAAPGTHTNWLADLFPELKFKLIDPNPFSAHKTAKVKIKQEYFTDDMACKYANKSVLFISDVRTANWREQDQLKVEQHVIHDMNAQQRWIEIMKPEHSMLKFRLPYPDRYNEPIEYLQGDIFLPVWGPQTTTETRLFTDGKSKKVWDHSSYEAYEDQMFYFNTVTRVARYQHGVRAEGLDGCYDCASEVHILRAYLEKYGLKCLPTVREKLTQWRKQTNRLCANQESNTEHADSKEHLLVDLQDVPQHKESSAGGHDGDVLIEKMAKSDLGDGEPHSLNIEDKEEMNWIIGRLSELISKVCSPKGRTLASPPILKSFAFDHTIKDHPLL